MRKFPEARENNADGPEEKEQPPFSGRMPKKKCKVRRAAAAVHVSRQGLSSGSERPAAGGRGLDTGRQPGLQSGFLITTSLCYTTGDSYDRSPLLARFIIRQGRMTNKSRKRKNNGPGGRHLVLLLFLALLVAAGVTVWQKYGPVRKYMEEEDLFPSAAAG